MIHFENLTKVFSIEGTRKVVADNINMTFPTGKSVALLGRNGAGKSTLLQMIAGNIPPSSGRIFSDNTISWPVGFGGSFHGDLTGAQNTLFIARVYGVNTQDLLEFVEEFAGLGDHFHLPLRTYSSGMRSRLAFGVSMGIDFGTYLVDEITAVGDAAFQARSNKVFLARMKSASAVVVSHSMGLVRQICDVAAVLEHGQLYYYEDLEAGIAHHTRNMKAG